VMVETEQYKNDLETLGCGCVVVVVVLESGEIGVGVLFQDDLVDVVTRSSERDMVRHATGHSGVQEGDQLALRVEDSCARVTFSREITMLSAPEVKDCNLPGLALEIPTGVRLELGLATKGKVGRLPLLGNGEARIVVLVEEVRVREACGIDATQEPEEVVLRVLKYGGVGGVGVEAGDDLGAGELAG
jgi:hypothetical protein